MALTLSPRRFLLRLRAKVITKRALSRRGDHGEARHRIHWHLGMGKTGTSYLQRCFSLNQAELWADLGIQYPPPLQRDGVPSAGNAAGVAARLSAAAKGAETAEIIDALARQISPNRRGDLLLSSELLYSSVLMTQPGKLQYLIEASRRLGYQPDFVLFVRDPTAHLVSAWLQHVSLKDPESELAEIAHRNRDSYKALAALLEYVANNDLMKLFHVRNYSRVHGDVLGTFFSLIGAERGSAEGAIQRGRHEITNRSLTPFEASILRLVARKVGKKRARQIGEAWSRLEVKDGVSIVSGLDLPTLREFAAQIAPDVRRVNEFLDEGSRLVVEIPEETEASGAENKYSEVRVAEALAHYLSAVELQPGDRLNAS